MDQGLNLDRRNLPATNGSSNLLDSLLANASGTSTHNIQGSNSQHDPFHDFGHGCIPIYSRHVSTPSIPDQSPPVFGRSSIGVRMRFGLGGMSIEASMGHPGHTGSGPMLFMTSSRRNQSSRLSPFGPMSGPFGQHMPGPFGQMLGPFGPMPGLFGEMSSPFGFPAFPFPPFGDMMSPHNTRDPFEETPFRTTQASCQNFSSNANEDEHYSGPIITEIFDEDDDDDEGRDDIAVVDNSDDDDGNTSQTDEDDLFGLTDDKRLNSDDFVQLVEMMKQTDDYLPSDKGYEEPVYVDRKFEEGSQSIEPGVQQPMEKKLDEIDAAPDQHVHSNANNEDNQTEKPTSKMKRSFRTQDFVDMPLFFGDMMMSSSESKPEHVEHTSSIPINEDEKLSEIKTLFSEDKPGSEQHEFKSNTSDSLKDTKPTYENVEASDMPNEMTGDGNNEHEQPGLKRKIHSIDTTSTQSTVEAALAKSHNSDKNPELNLAKSRSYEQDINGPVVAPIYKSPADIAKSGVLPEHSNEQNVDTSNADWRKAASQTETIHVRESPIVWDGDNTGDSIPNISKVETTSSEKPSQSFTHSASQFSDVSRSQKPSPVNSYSNLKWCYPGQAMKQGAGKYQNPAPGSWDASFADKNRQGQDHPANAWASHGNSDFDSLDDHALKEEALYLKQQAEQRIALREQHFQGMHGKAVEKEDQHSSSPGHIPESFNQFHHCQEHSCPSCHIPKVPVCHHHHHHQHCGHVHMDSTGDEHWEVNEHWQCHSFEDNNQVHGHSCGHTQVPPPYGGQCHHTDHQHCNHHRHQYGHRQGHNAGRYQPEGRANVHAYGESCAAQLDSITPVKPFRNKNASVRRRKTTSETPTEQKYSSGSYTSNRIKGNSESTNEYGHYNHREAFDALIESVGLQRKDVFTDGNCLFTAITDQLRIRGDFSFTAKTLRSAAVDYLKKNPNQDDGTPLFEFLDELEGNWDEYLTKMSRDGHWGDHIVIHALAHVLNRRIIIYRGSGELVKTVVEPRGNVTDDKNDISDETPVEEESKEKDEEPQTVTLDEMYLGHESESHYVSLRPLDWRDKLIEELRTETTSCLAGCNSSTMNIDTNGNTTPTRCAPNYTSYDANFIVNYILRGNFIHPNNMLYSKEEHQMASSQYSPDMLEMNKFVSSSGTRRSYHQQQKTYLISPSDTKVVLNEHGAHQRDLVVLTEGVPVGKLRLKPVQPSLWVPLTVPEMNTCVIRHASVTNHGFKEIRPQDETVLGFKAEWPPEADEWKSRKRASGWPGEALIGKILSRPVYVTLSKERESDPDATIWEYNFKEAERLLSLDIMNVSGLFLILNKMVKLVFKGKEGITNEHVKTAILYMREKFTTEEIKRSPATRVLGVIDAMLEYLKSGHFPCYFIRGKNLIAGLDYTERSWHIDRLNMLKKHFLVCLYFVIDGEKLNACFGFEKIVCGLTEAALRNQDVGSGEDSDIVSRHGHYVTLAIIAIQEWISRSHFAYAKKKLSTWLSDLRDNYNLHELSKERFLDFVLASLYGVDKWLLAFSMDLQDGTNTLKGVCEGQECANISLMFGDDVLPLLQKETSFKSDTLSVPTSIMLGSRLTLFACKLQQVLVEAECEEDAYQAAFHCFLKNNTHDLLLSVDKDRKEHNCSANVTLGDLKKLFDGLYMSYRATETVDTFRDLMDLYEEFCNVYESETDFEHLSSLWRWFNEPERAEAADMKADLVKTGSESYV